MQDDIGALLREIRDNQREALALQREHMDLHQQQLTRIERINDRAESIQGRAGQLLKWVAWLALPLLVLVIVLSTLP